MVQLALAGDFPKARGNLDKLIIHYGLSGEDVLNQVYREIPNLQIPEKKKVVLMDRIGEWAEPSHLLRR
jgi:replication factor C small subunit